jgi:phosphatidylglycerophosphatase C
MGSPTACIASPVDAPGGARRVVLFDFDGVLVRGDSFTRFMRARYASAWPRAIALLLAAPLLGLAATTRRGRRALVRGLVHWGLRGLDEDAYHARADAFGRELADDTRNLQRDAFTALNRHRHAGDRVVVVTGCEHALARAILDRLGLRDIELVASRFAHDGRGPRIACRNVGREKLRQLAALGIGPPWGVAYSDSLVDLPMLCGAAEAVLVNVEAARFERARVVLGERVRRVDWR